MSENKGPKKTFRNSGIAVNVWFNEKKIKGHDRKWYSITIDKNVKQEDGTWLVVKGLSMTDSLIASKLLNIAYGWCLENTL